ncbi:MAG: hypothetical protein KF893_10390 [Caldilineaceae bacterium]|nr:hypothetical protein [Caldilineaceae bacterium]
MDIHLPQTQNTLAPPKLLMYIGRLLLLGVAFLALLNVRAGAAQSNANITVSPTEGAAGEIFIVSGNGFTPGAATLFWDDQPIGTFTIKEGILETNLVAPSFAPPGEHKVSVCAGAPCLTGQNAQSASQTIKITEPMAVFAARIGFVHVGNREDEAIGLQFKRLLEAYGSNVRLIRKDETAKHDFSQYDLVIVSSSTGYLDTWGTVEEITQIARSPRILGLGEGGNALFGQMKLDIGDPYGVGDTTTGLVEMTSQNLIFKKTPHWFAAFNQRALPVYAETNQPTIHAVTFSRITSAMVSLAFVATFQNPTEMAVIVNQGCRTIWGFNDGPDKMTAAGRALFANTVFFALSTGCNFDTPTLCGPISSPAEIPSASSIDFDDLKGTTIIADLYRQSHSVRFEDSRLARATIKADQANNPQKSYSSPNAAFNTDTSGNGSANVPMRIGFDRSMSHAGVWLGNGDANMQATVRAYDIQGYEICAVPVPTVPAAHIHFAGIFDALGRIAHLEVDYGSSLRNESIDDLTFGPALYAEQIRICRTSPNGCVPVPNAPVHHLRDGKDTGEILYSDSNGYLTERGKIQFGDELWVRVPVSTTAEYIFYHTTETPLTVTPSAFVDGTMTINVGYPLMTFNLDIATQWDLSFDQAYRAELRTRIEEASNHLYDFTDGQMALGKVIIHQNYDKWDEADIRLYANNTLRPKAEIGGIVTAPTTDPLVAGVMYYPGYVYMGSTWSRYGTAFVPPGTLINQDWALALAHELGHYLLYLYDTYLSLNEQNEPVEIDTCTGSAMGWAYEEANTEFVFNVAHWNSACGLTLANQILKRTEWATIRLWYANLIEPTVVNPGPDAPPTSVTEVSFQPPSTPGTPGVNQTVALLYADAENASTAARGFLIRGQRVLDQGKPISGTTSITLSGAGTGDRFCLFDISSNGVSRRQFGCKIVAAGNNTLPLKKDLSWAPVVEISPVTSQTVTISVTQAVNVGQTLGAVLYPEDQNQATAINLTRNGELHTGSFVSPIPATSAYVTIHVNEAATETNPRREAMVEYGTGGSGAYGPAHRLAGMPIISGDGQAEYSLDETIELAEGEFITWQSMAGSPSSSRGEQIVGTSYRLVALPPRLAAQGPISIRLPDTPIPTARSLRQAEVLSIHLWQNGEWIPLASQQISDPQGGAKIIARSQGAGIYAILTQPRDLYLPIIQR